MERIVSFEEAKLLAELEFKENVDKVYDTNNPESELLDYGTDLSGDNELYAPTYKQAFKWLVAEEIDALKTWIINREGLLRELALERALIASSKAETDRPNRNKKKQK